jgi:hypothetical protein
MDYRLKNVSYLLKLENISQSTHVQKAIPFEMWVIFM